MKLYEIPWSIYPLRIAIYLAEKGIGDIERIDVPLPTDPSKRIGAGLTHAATLPALDTGDGPLIGSSVAILEYLEELYPTPNLIGHTPYARARTRELISISDEAAIHMGLWVHHANPLFAMFHKQETLIAEAGKEAYYRGLRLLDTMARETQGEFLAGDHVTIADCITFATQMTCVEQFGEPFPEGCEYLEQWFERFSKRQSGAVPQYPPFVLQMTKGTMLS